MAPGWEPPGEQWHQMACILFWLGVLDDGMLTAELSMAGLFLGWGADSRTHGRSTTYSGRCGDVLSLTGRSSRDAVEAKMGTDRYRIFQSLWLSRHESFCVQTLPVGREYGKFLLYPWHVFWPCGPGKVRQPSPDHNCFISNFGVVTPFHDFIRIFIHLRDIYCIPAMYCLVWKFVTGN